MNPTLRVYGDAEMAAYYRSNRSNGRKRAFQTITEWLGQSLERTEKHRGTSCTVARVLLEMCRVRASRPQSLDPQADRTTHAHSEEFESIAVLRAALFLRE